MNPLPELTGRDDLDREEHTAVVHAGGRSESDGEPVFEEQDFAGGCCGVGAVSGLGCVVEMHRAGVYR